MQISKNLVQIFIFIHLSGSLPQWPDLALLDDGLVRQEWIKALKLGDNGDFIPLENLIEKYGGKQQESTLKPYLE